MATRGRKPKHPGLEVLDGGRGKRAQPQTVEIPSEYPAFPPDFEHSELWAQLQGIFEENGTPIRSSDVFAIEELCDLIASPRRPAQDNPKALPWRSRHRRLLSPAALRRKLKPTAVPASLQKSVTSAPPHPSEEQMGRSCPPRQEEEPR